MINAAGTRRSAYKEYPKDYRYADGEEPDAVDFFDWWVEEPERRSARRKPARHLQAVSG
jgi:hypothetical protein